MDTSEFEISLPKEDIAAFIKQLVGKRMDYFCCEADMFDFGFSDLILHVPGFGRVIKNNDILVTTQDYQNWDGEISTNNDAWLNMKKYNRDIVGGIVVSAQMNEVNDLTVEMDNGVVISCFIQNSYPHYDCEQEQWILFEKGCKNRKFLTVYNKTIDFIQDASDKKVIKE